MGAGQATHGGHGIIMGTYVLWFTI